jgi:hypothetical protein
MGGEIAVEVPAEGEVVVWFSVRLGEVGATECAEPRVRRAG